VSTTISIPGSGNVNVNVFGRGTVIAGNGNDRIDIHGKGTIIVGSGHDTLTLNAGGVINQYGRSGHDTIHVGSTGNYIINEQGSATVTGAFGTATISHATLEIFQTGGQERVVVLPYGHETLQGSGSGFVGGHGSGSSGSTGHNTVSGSGSGHSTSSGHSSVTSGSSHSTAPTSSKSFDFHPEQKGPQHIIKNFVSGENHLFLDGHSLPFMTNTHEISSQGANTLIRMDHGQTTIELHVGSSLHVNNS
jgi:hypothetical protein